MHQMLLDQTKRRLASVDNQFWVQAWREEVSRGLFPLLPFQKSLRVNHLTLYFAPQ